MAGGFTIVVGLGLEPIPCWNPGIFLPPCFWFVLTGGHNGTCIRMDSIDGCLELDATALRWLLQFSNRSAIWAIDCSSDPIVQYCSNWQNQLRLLVNQQIVREMAPIFKATRPHVSMICVYPKSPTIPTLCRRPHRWWKPNFSCANLAGN